MALGATYLGLLTEMARENTLWHAYLGGGMIAAVPSSLRDSSWLRRGGTGDTPINQIIGCPSLKIGFKGQIYLAEVGTSTRPMPRELTKQPTHEPGQGAVLLVTLSFLYLLLHLSDSMSFTMVSHSAPVTPWLALDQGLQLRRLSVWNT